LRQKGGRSIESTPSLYGTKARFQFGTNIIELECIAPNEPLYVKAVELMDAYIDTISENGIPAAKEQEDGNEVALPDDGRNVASEKNGNGKPAKKDGRGGKRIPWVSKRIDAMCDAGKVVNVTWQDIQKYISDTWAENAPRKTILDNLKRRLNDTMTRQEDPVGSDNWKYTYRPKEAKNGGKAPKE
jgi:hypothetical protein